MICSDMNVAAAWEQFFHQIRSLWNENCNFLSLRFWPYSYNLRPLKINISKSFKTNLLNTLENGHVIQKAACYHNYNGSKHKVMLFKFKVKTDNQISMELGVQANQMFVYKLLLQILQILKLKIFIDLFPK